MELKDTVEMMNSLDYKERFKAEYHQVNIRYWRLNRALNLMQADALDFEPTCPYEVLRQQLTVMGDYLRVLEYRAEIEGIELSDEEE